MGTIEIKPCYVCAGWGVAIGAILFFFLSSLLAYHWSHSGWDGRDWIAVVVVIVFTPYVVFRATQILFFRGVAVRLSSAGVEISGATQIPIPWSSITFDLEEPDRVTVAKTATAFLASLNGARIGAASSHYSGGRWVSFKVRDTSSILHHLSLNAMFGGAEYLRKDIVSIRCMFLQAGAVELRAAMEAFKKAVEAP